ncbi:MAG: transcriptional regulator [Candidatus Aramenus sulfurataquae]|jgi:predicted transcriptional regulator|uniref:Transcriptional regulator n=2 Tax=Candidatus Aramenus sulfurataquae TaxID=1326980 RepID=W7KJX9_9CREN|nr:MAG: transcriptional regulator [Candidatus Aramenus sulfurataquae]MCL7343845.1 GntR family transcriptional regulator [Candidatus Aramenus sulfurataquae]
MEESLLNRENENEKWHNIKCCYRLSETEVACFIKLNELGKPVTSQELAGIMRFSKTTVESSLRRLIDLGLVVRKKLEGSRIGRPKYVYSLPTDLWDKVKVDLHKCAESMRNTKL